MQRHFKLRSSRFLAFLILFLSVISLVSLWTLPLPVLVLFVLTVMLLSWGGYFLLLDANLRSNHSCVAFRLEDDDGIVLVLRSGRHVSGRVLQGSLVASYLVILNIALRDRRCMRSILVLPDAMSADSFRRLRVRLVWGEGADKANPV